MPLDKDLFGLVNDQKFSDALTLLKQHPNLVNAVKEGIGYSLLQSFINHIKPGDNSQALVEHIVTHPLLDLNFNSRSRGRTQISLVDSGRLDLISLILNKKEFLFIEGKPTYIEAKQSLQYLSKNLIKLHARKNPGSPPLDPMTDPKIANIAKIVTQIREATVKFAVTQDDADLIIQLQKADANAAEYEPGGTLSQLIITLVKPNHVKINGWLAGTYPPAPQVQVAANKPLPVAAAAQPVADKPPVALAPKKPSIVVTPPAAAAPKAQPVVNVPAVANAPKPQAVATSALAPAANMAASASKVIVAKAGDNLSAFFAQQQALSKELDNDLDELAQLEQQLKQLEFNHQQERARILLG